MREYALPIRFGLATSGCLIAYFLILALFGLHIHMVYSVFNAVITGFGIYEAIKYYQVSDPNRFNYGKGFIAGMVTGGVATLVFTAFFALYATEIDDTFIGKIATVWTRDLTDFPGIVFLAVAIMGFASTLVLTLAIMQLFKSSHNPGTGGA